MTDNASPGPGPGTDATTTPTDGAGPSAPAAPATTPEAPPAWFAAYAEQQTAAMTALKRELGGQIGQLRGKKTTPASGDSPTPAESGSASQPTPGPTFADVTSAMRLGQLTQNLPESIRAEVMQRAEGGDFQGAASMAEMAAKMAQELAAKKPATAPRAHQGSAPSEGSGNYPKSITEWLEIKAKDPSRAARLDKDDGFNPFDLKP